MARSKEQVRLAAAKLAAKLAHDLEGQVRLVLDTRSRKCDPKCPGWFIDRETCDVHRCDECANYGGYASHINDSMCAVLSESDLARRTVIKLMSEDA